MPRRIQAAILVIYSLMLASCGQLGWVRVDPETSPPASGQGAVAYMDSSGTAVLFGGITETRWLNETWIWDGENWQQVMPQHSPPARETPTMSYDADRDRVVLFGGAMQTGLFDDTWEWDGQDWQLMDPPHRPPARCCHAMAYDSAGKKTIIYGGYDSVNSAFLSDMWAWDGQDWYEMTCCGMLGEMSGHAMVDFPAKREVISVQTAGFGTWAWNGTMWNRFGTIDPPHRSEGRIAYDSRNQWAVFFGASRKPGCSTTHGSSTGASGISLCCPAVLSLATAASCFTTPAGKPSSFSEGSAKMARGSAIPGN